MKQAKTAAEPARAVTRAPGAQAAGFDDAFGSVGLAGVQGDGQTGVAHDPQGCGVVAGREAEFGAGQVVAHLRCGERQPACLGRRLRTHCLAERIQRRLGGGRGGGPGRKQPPVARVLPQLWSCCRQRREKRPIRQRRLLAFSCGCEQR